MENVNAAATTSVIPPASGGGEAPASNPTITAPSSSSEASPAPVAETAKPEEVKTETPSQNVLGDAQEVKAPESAEAKVEVKPNTQAEVKPEQKVDAVKAEVAALPVYEFKLPENVKVDEAPFKEFQNLLGELETATTKLDHEALQERGQKLIDMHVKGVEDSIQRLNDSYLQFHKSQGEEWLSNFRKDPELGAGNIEETVSNLRKAVESYAGNETQLTEFRELMQATNVGKHPALIRLIKNMNDKITKYETETDTGNSKTNRSVPAQKPAPSSVKSFDRFYAGKSA